MLFFSRHKAYCLLACLFMPLMACQASDKTVANKDDSQAIVKKFEAAYSEQAIKVKSAKPAEIKGFYELILEGNQIIYIDKDAHYMFVGDIIDIRNKRDVTSERMKELSAIDYKKLPFDQAIKEVRGNGKLQVAVFSDPDCPYCKKLEQEFEKIDNITIYNFMLPIPALHSRAQHKAEQIWCQKDRTAAWTSWMRIGKLPEKVADCKNPVQETMRLGEALGFNGTPALVFPNGQTQMGYSPVSALLPAIEQNQ